MHDIFSDEENFEKIYSESMEEAPQAPEQVSCAYSSMHDAFEECLNSIQEYMFRYAYQCGYKAAQKESQGKKMSQYPFYLLNEFTSMSDEEYRKYTSKMLESIDNKQDLKQIYTVVHRKFINQKE